MERKQVYREVLSIALDDCSLDELLQKLNECKEKHPTENLQVTYDGEYCQYNGPSETTVFYYSPETDEELQRRLDYEREKLETKERKELGRLISAKKLNAANQKRFQELMEKYHNG